MDSPTGSCLLAGQEVQNDLRCMQPNSLRVRPAGKGAEFDRLQRDRNREVLDRVAAAYAGCVNAPWFPEMFSFAFKQLVRSIGDALGKPWPDRK